jgi:glycosidase
MRRNPWMLLAPLLACSHPQVRTDAPADAGGDGAVDGGPVAAPDVRAAWRGRSIYFVLTDRFANGDPSNDDANGYRTDLSDGSAWHGGDLKGLTEHLDYIQGMGFDALWITPVVTQHHPHGYHGYWGWDFYTVDGHLGAMADLQALVARAHGLGMKVLLDTVANHTGNYQYQAPTFPKASLYHHNGPITDYSNQAQVETGDVSNLNDLAQENPETRQILLDHVAWLVTTTGVDGLRLDTAKHVPRDFLAEYTQRAGVLVMGEVYQGDVAYVAPYTRAMSSVLDYPLYYALTDVFAKGQSFHRLQGLLAQDGQYADPDVLGTFLDNHDQPRFLCAAPGDDATKQARLRLGLTFLLTARGAPVVYYGTEQGFSGCADPANREDLFGHLDPHAPLYGVIAGLNAARHRVPALRTGAQTELFASDDVYAFARRDGASAAVVVLNQSTTPITVSLSNLYGFSESKPAWDELADAASEVTVKAGAVRVVVGPRQARVLSNR